MSGCVRPAAGSLPLAALPPLYGRWVADLLEGAPIPAEVGATCDDCAMAAPRGEAPRDAGTYFDVRVKCCSFVPTLPNFLVGRILLERGRGAAERSGRASVEARIRAGVGVSPLGVSPPPTFVVLYRSAAEAFGRARALRCPHFVEEGGLCGIWKHRNSTCATWFCKFVRGQTGRAFWRELQEFLAAIERSLTRFALLEIDPGPESLAALYPPTSSLGAPAESLTAGDLDGEVEPERRRTLWGRFLGRERELYQRAARLVDRLAWADVLRIGGSEVALRARLVRDAHASFLDEELPERVGHGSYSVVGSRGGVVRILGYSALDPLDVPAELVAVLEDLAAGDAPLARLLEQIEARRGVAIDPAVVRRLLDFGILKARAHRV